MYVWVLPTRGTLREASRLHLRCVLPHLSSWAGSLADVSGRHVFASVWFGGKLLWRLVVLASHLHPPSCPFR